MTRFIQIFGSFCWFIFSISYCEGNGSKTRYLLYDCNPFEGFNLRRDVYLRMSMLIHNLNQQQNWILVLPPWGGISYHWGDDESKILWSKFFDLSSLNNFVPVMEYEDYVETIGEPKIDEVWYLQDYEGEIDYENWENKIDEKPCVEPVVYETDRNMKYRGWFWSFEETYANLFKCVSYQGDTKMLVEPLLGKNTTAISVMIDKAEIILFAMYGGKLYWDGRRSMVFANHLQEAASNYRQKYLNSTDLQDRTVMQKDWRDNHKKEGDAIGGPYIAAHLRRKDFVYNRRSGIPSLKFAAETLRKLTEKFNVSKIFIASDGNDKDINELRNHLPDMFMYQPTLEEKRKYKKGGIAIIDQIICAHARYFIGTEESTFSFRIMEEREIMGFEPEVTYNRFCNDNDTTCEQPERWKVVWEDDSELWY